MSRRSKKMPFKVSVQGKAMSIAFVIVTFVVALIGLGSLPLEAAKPF